MTMDNWVKEYLGKGLDYDFVYGIQCVDLVKHFAKHVLEINPESIGNAIEYYNKRNTSPYLVSNFDWHSNTPKLVPKKGDICVFTSKSGNGHVSVATGEGNTSYFYSYDQNYPSAMHEPMTKCKHSYSSLLGVLRPKNQKNISSNAPTILYGNYILLENKPVYTGYGSDYTQKRVSELTEDGRKHATSTDIFAPAYIKKGTKITILSTNLSKAGNLWARIPSGYICIWHHKTNKLFIK